jgi:hypothetical protein
MGVRKRIMIDIMWYILGFLLIGGIYLVVNLSKKYRLGLLHCTGFIMGLLLILFSIAWSVSSTLEGEPRAANMGIVFFGLPGIALLTVTARFVSGKSQKQ